MTTTVQRSAAEAAESLRTDALDALAELEAAAAADQAHRHAARLDRAENHLHRTIRAIIGPDPYFAVQGEIELEANDPDGYLARVAAGGLTLIVERTGVSTDVTLMVPCIDCGEEARYGSHIGSLAELGRAIRDSGLPCRDCVGRDPWGDVPTAKPLWVIDRCHTLSSAEELLNEWAEDGYETALHVVGDDYVVSGHRFDGF